MPTTTTTTTTVHPSSSSANETNGTSQKEEKKKKGLLGMKSPFKFIGGSSGGSSGGKTYCRGCKKKCSGEVLRVNDVYFHTHCFQCRGCGESLSQGGFFTKDREYYCAKCYQSNFGTKCNSCGKYVEGEVVTALGKTYHQNCFKCAGCKRPFPTGERVTFTGKACLCQKCVKSDIQIKEQREEKVVSQQPTVKNGGTTKATSSVPAPVVSSKDDICAGCNEELRDGQALMALDKQYHVWCFKCKACDLLLHGEYMGKDGHPYCEKDYQQLFGVKCTYCRRFISGKVLQAGDNNHFHPTCARCTKCGDPFGDGEEMFLQGAAIWHPRCGPGPSAEDLASGHSGGFIVNGFDNSGGGGNHSDYHDGTSMASTSAAGLQYSRASSPGASLINRGRSSADPYFNNSYYDSGRFSRSTTYMPASGYHGFHGSGLYTSSSTYSLRRPLEPGDRVDSLTNVNHFHLPPSRLSSSSSRYMIPSAQAQALAHAQQQAMYIQQQQRRPISCPPKPGYTQMKHFNDFSGRSDDLVSQQSFRTDYTDSILLRPSATYSHGFGSLYDPPPRTPLPGRPHTPGPFVGEHKTYPLHVLFTSNYKLPPDVDRCNLEMHLNDEDFEMALAMTRKEFYTLPFWKKNDLKRRVKLF